MQGRRDARAQWHASDYQSCGVAGLVDVLSVFSLQIFKCSHNRAVNSTGQYSSWIIFNFSLNRAMN